jgi:hypothetical protein
MREELSRYEAFKELVTSAAATLRGRVTEPEGAH